MMSLDKHTYSYIFTATRSAALLLKRYFARNEESGSFGAHIATFDDVIQDAWELFGDGRRMVTSFERQLFMQKALSEIDMQYRFSSGVSTVLSRCVELYSGISSFEELLLHLDDDAYCRNVGITYNERKALRAVEVYRRRLHSAFLVEYADVVSMLESVTLFAADTDVLFYECDVLTPLQKKYFDSCSDVRVHQIHSANADGLHKLSDSVRLRFAFPAGRYARPAYVRQIIRSSVEESCILCISPQPEDLFESLVCACADDNFKFEVYNSRSFATTDIGRACGAVYKLAHKRMLDSNSIHDFLLLPLSGVSKKDAWNYDVLIQSDRLYDIDQALMFLREKSPIFCYLEELIEDPQADILIGALSDEIKARCFMREAYVAEQLSALNALVTVLSAARLCDASIDEYISLLNQSQIRSSRCVGNGSKRIVIADSAYALRFEASSFDKVIACDMDSEHYAIKPPDDFATRLANRLGIDYEIDPFARARCNFATLMQLPRFEFIVDRALNDADANPTYPAFVVEELVNCYRDDVSLIEDIDNMYALPAALQEGMYECGEEDVVKNAHGDLRHRLTEVNITHARDTHASEDMCDIILAPYAVRKDVVVQRPVVSPSMLEVCLECPYKWFASRRMNTQSFIEGFGAAQKGDFMHRSLELFYKRFQEETGTAKVRLNTLSEARVIMNSILDELAQQQKDIPVGRNRLIPLTSFEQQDLFVLKRNILGYLDYETQLLPDFEPTYFEYRIPFEKQLMYAGCYVVGKVDRIDVDGHGNAVIIDYKSSIKESHTLRGDKAGGRKVQTLIYAALIEKLLGLRVVGALYVGVHAKPALAGAYDQSVLSPFDLPHIKCENCACFEPTFEEVVKETEEEIAAVIRDIEAGNIEQVAHLSNACDWCINTTCPGREQ